MTDTINTFINECSSCTQCGSECPFLEEYGSPEDIIANSPQLAFLCSNCTGCDRRCPLDLSPSRALFETKQKLIAENKVPAKAADAIKSARKFAERGHKKPFVRYDQVKTGFWPGCSLAGTSPEATEGMRLKLQEILGTDVGMVLDCCFDPCYQNGDTEPVKGACGTIEKRLDEAGIERLIVGCANCRKVFDRFLPELKAEYALEALPDDILEELPEEDLYLHYPCPFYHVEGIAGKAHAIMDTALPKDVDVDAQIKPACCGFGGSLNNQDQKLADRFTEKVTMAAYGASIVTACMGCKNTFIKKGTHTYHILELVAGVEPKVKAVGSVKKWGNRLKLARG
jgi:Fe-S oxidoreductase